MLLMIMLYILECSSSLSLPELKRAAETRKVELKSDSLAAGRFTLSIQTLDYPITCSNVQIRTLRIVPSSKYGAINERTHPGFLRGSNHEPDHEAAILTMDEIGTPGEGTRPIRGRFCGACRPGALTRRG